RHPVAPVPRSTPAGWLPALAINAGLPLGTYLLLAGHGVATVPALVLSGVWPLGGLLITVVRGRRLDELGVLTLVVIGLGVIGALVFANPRLVLVKDPAITGVFGLILLGSLLCRRPLMFYFGRRFATDGSPQGVAGWNHLWQHAEFRRSQRTLTLAWGACFTGEAAVRTGLAYVLPTSAVVVVNSALPVL